MTAARILETGSLGDRAAAWDALVLASDLPTPFLRTWWLDGVGTDAAHFVLVLDGDTLLGGLALERRRRGGVDLLRALGGGKLCPDHLDLVADPTHRAEVVTALGGWFRSGGNRLLDIDGLREEPALARAIPGRVSLIDVAPYELLPADPEDYLAARSRSFAKRYRKYRRRTENAGVTYRQVPTNEVAAAMDDFTAMHAARDDRTELARELPRIARAVELGSAAGEVRLYAAEAEGRRGAVLMLFTTGGRVSVYQTARLVGDATFNHVGTVVDVVAISDACTEGSTEVDFLRGDEEYKRSFVAGERALLRLQAAHGPLARLLLLASLAVGAARRRLGAIRRALRARSGPAPEASSDD